MRLAFESMDSVKGKAVHPPLFGGRGGRNLIQSPKGLNIAKCRGNWPLLLPACLLGWAIGLLPLDRGLPPRLPESQAFGLKTGTTPLAFLASSLL